ncbi:MAG: phenylalanine--tRNA ligase subunit beta [Vampirovibrionales bacterium]|nr:phenylalanine--tRNA ligase subunit beta [Vampirovibrionales bacterium]
MKISLEWLSQYVDIKGLSPEAIADALTRSGLEVEAIDKVGAAFNNVVVAKCIKLEAHPNADKLRLATVDIGTEQIRVVCGAKNLAEGMLIAFAKDGAQVINRKDGTPFTLGKANIRGVDSVGMVCSLDELGLQDLYPKEQEAHSGIWPIQDYANESQLGEDLAVVLGLDSDRVLHTAPTANRGDQMSMIGVAREVAALFDRKLTLPEIPKYEAKAKQPSIKIELKDPDVCAYYGGLMLDNSKAVASPEWLKRRVEAAGTRSINVIVDVTNYVMLEMGQPLHAFDRDKFEAGEILISVRRAVADERFTTLDDTEHKLTADSVLITLNDKPVALAGVMGGQNTQISDDSKNLLLEAAYFPPASNRKNAKSVGIRTESSARFERGVDRYNTQQALFRAAQLMEELTGATPTGLTQSEPLKPELPTLALRLARIEQVIGLSIPKERVQSILEKLGFLVNAQADTWQVTVPSWRLDDVTREIDLIEEVIRIYGYDEVPYTLPKKAQPVPFSLRQDFIDRVQECLHASGCLQVMTSSLIGHQLLEKTGFSLDQKQLITVLNSHSADHTLMRQSLAPSLLEVARHNQAQGISDVWIYELGKTYFKVAKPGFKQTGVSEKLNLGILLCGQPQQGQWNPSVKTDKTDFYLLKGTVENLLHRLFGKFLPVLSFSPETELNHLHPGKAAQILLEGKPVGVFGELHPLKQSALKLRQPVYVAELNLELIFKRYKQALQAPEPVQLSPYPAVDRDMALLAKAGVTHQQILETVRGLQNPLLQSVTLFDEYKGDKLPEGARSLAYRMTFQSNEGTLSDQQIEAAVNAIKAKLSEKLPVELR